MKLKLTTALVSLLFASGLACADVDDCVKENAQVCFTSTDSEKHPASMTRKCTAYKSVVSNVKECTGQPVPYPFPDSNHIGIDTMPYNKPFIISPYNKPFILSLTVKISFDTCSQEFDKDTWFNIFEGTPKVYVCDPATGTFNLQ